MASHGGTAERLGGFEDDYIIFDCPGQIELYTHIPVMKQLVQRVLQQDYRVAAVYLLDAQFLASKNTIYPQ